MIKKYSKCKQSGIEWIGEIPNHWNKLKIGRTFRKIGSGTTPKSGSDIYYENGNINWLNTGDLNDSYITETNKKITEAALSEFSTLKLYPKNSIVIALYGATIGKLGHLKIETTTNQACCVLSDSDNIENRYLFYFLLSAREHIISKAYGGGQPNISQDLIKQLYISAPTKEEQYQIIDYLDHQTAIIGHLIQQKEKLIELLKEKREAVINEAVTKGLNPNAKMKDSGIEWLGQVPEHWKVARIGHYTQLIRGASPRPAGDPRYFGGDFIPWITVGEVTNGDDKYVLSTENYLTKEGSEKSRIIYPETLLLSNSGATLGVPKISKITGCINDGSVAFVSLNKELERDFLFYFFKTHTEIYRQEMSGYGQPNLNTEIIKSTKFPLPPINEQKEIVNFIDSEFKELDKILILSGLQIEKLKDYRQAIISEAVIGKIDLRDWKKSEPLIKND